MRRIFRILTLILVYLIVSAKSCDNNEQSFLEIEKYKAARARDSITSIFETDTPDQQVLRAFEVTAKLKLNDLADYLRIMNDSSDEKAFQDKAAEMAKALFIPGNNIPAGLSGAEFDSIRVLKPLQRDSDSLYSGKLSFTVRYSHSSRSGRDIPPIKTKIADIFILKQEKVFGKDTIRVWNVLLGDIR